MYVSNIHLFLSFPSVFRAVHFPLLSSHFFTFPRLSSFVTEVVRALNIGPGRVRAWTAMFTALKRLGYHPCCGTRMQDNPSKYLTLWTEAMRAKYFGEGKAWGTREFDVVLGDFDVRTSLFDLSLVIICSSVYSFTSQLLLRSAASCIKTEESRSWMLIL